MKLTKVLVDAFDHPDPVYFAWQTSAAYVAEQERALVREAFLPLGRRVLDLGCGQGATLRHAGAGSQAVGVDLFASRVRFAAGEVPGPAFLVGSGERLPFADGAFDHVVIRDVIHHLDDAPAVLAECRRVLCAGGRLDVLEPCAANPLIALQALTRPVERGELRSTERALRSLLEASFRVEQVRRLQALPLHRVVLHPGMGWPALGTFGMARRLIAAAERAGELLLPRFSWAYIHLRAYRSS